MAEDAWQDVDNLANMERTVFGSGIGAESGPETAKRLFNEHAADAALTIIHTAKHGSTDRVRLDAAKYITERALGPVKDSGAGSEHEDQMMKVLREITGISN